MGCPAAFQDNSDRRIESRRNRQTLYMHQFFRLLRHSSHLALAVLGVPLCGQNLLPNPGMEGGGDRPAGWTLSGGDQGAWASPGHQGRRCLAITGDGKNSFCWRSEELSLRPGGLYRLRFWGRCEGDVTGGCVTAGSSRVNHDFRFTETWQPYSLVLAVPADGAKDFIRLGQWEQKGTVCFDDVELTPLAAISMGYGKALELGDGESLDNGVYRCVVNLGGPGGNYHHALIESRCGFNSDRWTFSAGQRVIYAHKLASGGFADARLKINMSYYVGGALKVEASPNGEAWETASVLDGARPGGEIELPPSVLSSGHIFIRLTGEGPSCNLQVSGYELEAALKEPRGAEVQGKTFFLESRQTCPELDSTSGKSVAARVFGGVGVPVVGQEHVVLALGFAGPAHDGWADQDGGGRAGPAGGWFAHNNGPCPTRQAGRAGGQPRH